MFIRECRTLGLSENALKDHNLLAGNHHNQDYFYSFLNLGGQVEECGRPATIFCTTFTYLYT
jgi:hypothetical protein